MTDKDVDTGDSIGAPRMLERNYGALRIEMRELPILFNGPMVRALLAGQKTVTRRVCKHRYGIEFFGGQGDEDDPECWGFEGEDGRYGVLARGLNERHSNGGVSIPCPYGVPGDRLWVRETFSPDWCDHVIYRADGGSARGAGYDREPKWKPSIFMPRRLSRLLLEVTDVRVERVGELTKSDAAAEGLTRLTKDEGRVWKYGIPDRDGMPGTDDDGWPWSDWDQDPCVAFRRLWDGINAKRGYGWDVNPWVWAVSFRRVEPGEASGPVGVGGGDGLPPKDPPARRATD